MKIYLSTPVTSRQEKTYDEQYKAAVVRTKTMADFWKACRTNREKPDHLVSFADVVPPWNCPEAEAMARCIQSVLTCEAILMDEGWQRSRGCLLEFMAALLYKKEIYYVRDDEIEKRPEHPFGLR